MTVFSTRSFFPLLLILVIGLTGCQDSLVEPATPPADLDAPMTQAEFDKQLAETGMVVLQPKDYEAFGGPLDATNEAKQSCNAKSRNDINYRVCSDVASIVIDNVDFFRVTIDASIIPSPNATCGRSPDGSFTPCVESGVFVSVTSSTVRGDGVVLQDGEYDGGEEFASTDFVAVYPQADTFTFDHTSDFTPVFDQISVHLSP